LAPHCAFAKLAILLLCFVGTRAAHAGSLEFEQDPASGDYADTDRQKIVFTVATYNVQARPFLDGAEGKFQAIAPRLNQFDIVALQECFVAHRSLWAQTTFPVRIYDGSRTDWYRLVSSGLSVLSRFRVLEVSAEKFRDPEGLRFVFRAKNDGLASKGILFARLDLGNGRALDLYNVHMEAGGDDASNEARRLQTKQLINYILAESPPENAVLVVGDFNMKPSAKRKTLVGQYPKDLTGLGRSKLLDVILGELELANAGSLSGAPPPNLIDHILYRSGTTTKLKPAAWRLAKEDFLDEEGAPLSDHDPVVTTFIAD
jgi:endonuclease/exonuclease/phosphatase family metal-dependent hydrolase